MLVRRLLLAALAAVPALTLAAPAAPSARLTALERAYLDGLFRAKPHLADYMGDHRFASRVSDLTPAGVARRVRELDAQATALAALDRARLTEDERVDAGILSDGIGLERLELTEIREWTWNPGLTDTFTYYDPREVVATRLADLAHATWGTPARRLAAAEAQLRALPGWLRARQAALSGPVSRAHLDQAIADNRGRIAFFESDVAALTRGAPSAEAARRAAVAALRAYQDFMERELSARATRDFRLGPALYAKKFPLALQTEVKPEEMVRRAREDFARTRTELLAVARRLSTELFPGEAPLAEGAGPEDEARLIRRVKDALSADHPAPDQLVRASAEKLEALRAFVDAHGLLTLPPRDTLTVAEMPEWKRGGGGAEYLSPGGLDRDRPFHGTYFVEPPSPSWPPEKTESYLRANNHYEVTLTAAHEALPGHHAQAWWARRDPSALRATLWSGPFAEGWAMYGEGLLARLGYGGAQADRYRFFELQGRMIVATNAILDAGLQGGAMTGEEALRLMIDEGFQEKAQAEKKLVRAQLDSTQLCQYFLGQTELEALEAEARERGAFDQRRFDEALLSHGTIAPKHLRAFVLAALGRGAAGGKAAP